MNDLLFAINLRIEDVFFALLAVTLLQTIFMLFAFMLKKSIPCMPLIELILRPIVVMFVDKLNRDDRSKFALIIRGSFVFIIVIFLLFLIGFAMKSILTIAGISQYFNIIMLSFMLSPITVMLSAGLISIDKPWAGSFKHIAQGLNINLVRSDKHGLRRASCKSCAMALNEWCVAPIVIYLLGGLNALYFYIAISLVVRVSGQNQSPFTNIFGIIYNVVKYITSLISVIIVGVASIFSTGGQPLRSCYAFKHGVDVMGESVFAYTQKITLGGVYQNRFGEAITLPWVGDDGSTAKLSHQDVLRVIIEYGISVFLLLVALFAMYAFI